MQRRTEKSSDRDLRQGQSQLHRNDRRTRLLEHEEAHALTEKYKRTGDMPTHRAKRQAGFSGRLCHEAVGHYLAYEKSFARTVRPLRCPLRYEIPLLSVFEISTQVRDPLHSHSVPSTLPTERAPRAQPYAFS